MIDPNNITNYNRTKNELEEYLLFCIVVAGKTADTQAKALDRFLGNVADKSPFQIIRDMIKNHTFDQNLINSKIGQYNKISLSFEQAAKSDLDLFTCTAKDLEEIYGIGPKTSRLFLVHSRAKQNYAILDTHILRFMRERLGIDTPKATPNQKQYEYFEQLYLDFARKTQHTIADLDLMIWRAYSSGNPQELVL